MAALKIRFRNFWNSLLGRNVWLLFFLAALLLAIVNVFIDRRGDFSEFTAGRLTRVVNGRFSRMEG